MVMMVVVIVVVVVGDNRGGSVSRTKGGLSAWCYGVVRAAADSRLRRLPR